MKKSVLLLLIIYSNICFAQQGIIDGYTDKSSYRAGETIHFYLNGFGDSAPIGLSDANGNFLFFIDYVNLDFQYPAGSEPWKNGFGYSETFSWTVPSDLPSGFYQVYTQGEFSIPIVIKGNNNESGGIVIIIPTNTDQAYNTQGDTGNIYGAHSFYDKYEDPPFSNIFYSYPVLSIHRPMQSHQFEYYLGFLKWMTNTNYSENYNLNYISDTDMDDYDEIKNAKLMIIIGHSEYWTREARLNFDRFVEKGMEEMNFDRNILVLSGNSMWWQVRYSPDKTQLICYKGKDADINPLDVNAPDPLLRTYQWTQPSLRYSILSSIGSDARNAGFGSLKEPGVTDSHSPDDLNGYKIVSTGSPIFAGITISSNIEPVMANKLDLRTNEFDGTIISNPSGALNGDAPLADKPALGFYHAEVIAYDRTSRLYEDESFIQPEMKYCPIMAFQKTCSSGKVINVNSINWCDEEAFATPNQIPAITHNMMDLLLSDDNIFTTSPETGFELDPNDAASVSYEVTENGFIEVTPCGINMSDVCTTVHGYETSGGFKVDRTDKGLSLSIISCYDPALRIGNTTKEANKESEQNVKTRNERTPQTFEILPNPTSGKITIKDSDNLTCNRSIMIYNVMGEVIFMNKTQASEMEIDLTEFAKGIYVVKIQKQETTAVRKVVLQ